MAVVEGGWLWWRVGGCGGGWEGGCGGGWEVGCGGGWVGGCGGGRVAVVEGGWLWWREGGWLGGSLWWRVGGWLLWRVGGGGKNRGLHTVGEMEAGNGNANQRAVYAWF